MSIWTRLFGGTTTASNGDGVDLAQIWDLYCEQWPENNTRFDCWKPARLLPASKGDVRTATRTAYAKWPGTIDWQVYSAFFMEYIDIALHLSEIDYATIQEFRSQYQAKRDDGKIRDPLLSFNLCSVTAVMASETILQDDIVRIRDNFIKYIKMDHPAAPLDELEKVRAILLEAATEFVTQVAAWRAYIVSIGRDTYVK